MHSPLPTVLKSYLLFRVSLLIGGMLAVAGATVAIRIGGVVGMLVIMGLVFLVLFAFGIAISIR